VAIDGRLDVYKDDDEHNLLFSIPLEDCQVENLRVRDDDDLPEYGLRLVYGTAAILVMPGREHLFVADSVDDQVSWSQAIMTCRATVEQDQNAYTQAGLGSVDVLGDVHAASLNLRNNVPKSRSESDPTLLREPTSARQTPPEVEKHAYERLHEEHKDALAKPPGPELVVILGDADGEEQGESARVSADDVAGADMGTSRQDVALNESESAHAHDTIRVNTHTYSETITDAPETRDATQNQDHTAPQQYTSPITGVPSASSGADPNRQVPEVFFPPHPVNQFPPEVSKMTRSTSQASLSPIHASASSSDQQQRPAQEVFFPLAPVNEFPPKPSKMTRAPSVLIPSPAQAKHDEEVASKIGATSAPFHEFPPTGAAHSNESESNRWRENDNDKEQTSDEARKYDDAHHAGTREQDNDASKHEKMAESEQSMYGQKVCSVQEDAESGQEEASARRTTPPLKEDERPSEATSTQTQTGDESKQAHTEAEGHGEVRQTDESMQYMPSNTAAASLPPPPPVFAPPPPMDIIDPPHSIPPISLPPPPPLRTSTSPPPLHAQFGADTIHAQFGAEYTIHAQYGADTISVPPAAFEDVPPPTLDNVALPSVDQVPPPAPDNIAPPALDNVPPSMWDNVPPPPVHALQPPPPPGMYVYIYIYIYIYI
jgi:hypothetical protein